MEHASTSFKDDNKKRNRQPTLPKLDIHSYKSMSGLSQHRFSALAKIVRYLRSKHQEGDDYPLTLEEILDETNQLHLGNSIKSWLINEALPQNPKLEVVNGDQYVYKPVYKIKDSKDFMRLLKQHELKSLGGILLEDIQESLPHYERVLKHRASDIVHVPRPVDKKKILFYYDHNLKYTVDEEFQKLWRLTTVDAIDEGKIDEYLQKQGIRSMQNFGPKKLAPLPLKRRKPINGKRLQKKPKDNEHLADVLEVYDHNKLTEKNTQ